MSARLAAGLLAGLLIALSPIGSAKAAPFRLIVTELEPPLLPNSVMELALNEGYFTREGVEVELVRVQQTPSAIAAIAAGEGEMANIGLDALLQLHARGALAVGAPYRAENILGVPFAACVTGTAEGEGGQAAVIPEVRGMAHISAFSTLVLEAEDPLPAGFLPS